LLGFFIRIIGPIRKKRLLKYLIWINILKRLGISLNRNKRKLKLAKAQIFQGGYEGLETLYL